MASEIEKLFKTGGGGELTTEINQPVGSMIILNPQNSKITFDRDLSRFLGINGRLTLGTFIERLNIPSTHFVYCDLVDPSRNLADGKASTLLAKFDVRGKPLEEINYKRQQRYAFVTR